MTEPSSSADDYDEADALRRAEAMAPENALLCQETAIRLLEARRDADPRSDFEAATELALMFCELGFTAEEVAEMIVGLGPLR